MDDTWDKDYNQGSVSQLTLDRIERAEQERLWQQEEEDRRANRIARGYIDIPIISSEVVITHFPKFAQEEEDEFGSPMARWAANRMIWVCHNCGAFGYKYSLNERFRCYCCRSRNVQVLRSGEMSLAIRNLVPASSVGQNMNDIYIARRERLRQARIARRHT
jgi:hypothetical protein